MILSLMIWLLIALVAYCGFRVGLIKELTKIFSYPLALGIAVDLARPVSTWFQLADHRDVIDGVACLVIFVASRIFLRSLGLFLDHQFARLPVIHLLNKIGGVVFGGLIGCLLAFLVLSVALRLPSEQFDQQYSQSPVAHLIVSQVPVTTHNLLRSWLRL